VLADELQGELDVVLVHKLGAPGHAELAIGAVDESGQVWLDPETRDLVHPAWVRHEASRQLHRLRERRVALGSVRPPIDRAGRTVVVVDDGVATGSSMLAALQVVRAQGPGTLVAAAPVMSGRAYEVLRGVADQVVALVVDDDFRAVGEYYSDFREVSDRDVLALLATGSRSVEAQTSQGARAK
jgi:predicted phosphoribosyltransferase